MISFKTIKKDLYRMISLKRNISGFTTIDIHSLAALLNAFKDGANFTAVWRQFQSFGAENVKEPVWNAVLAFCCAREPSSDDLSVLLFI